MDHRTNPHVLFSGILNTREFVSDLKGLFADETPYTESPLSCSSIGPASESHIAHGSPSEERVIKFD